MTVAAFANPVAAEGRSFAEILLAVADYLPGVVKLARARVKVVADRKIDPRAVAETHLRVRPLKRKGQPDPGGGRNASVKTRTFAVDIIVRNARDEPGDDTHALTDPDNGVIPLEEAVFEALDGHAPSRTNADGSVSKLTLEPLHEVETDDPNRPLPADGFCTETVYFEAKFAAPYTTART